MLDFGDLETRVAQAEQQLRSWSDSVLSNAGKLKDTYRISFNSTQVQEVELNQLDDVLQQLKKRFGRLPNENDALLREEAEARNSLERAQAELRLQQRNDAQEASSLQNDVHFWERLMHMRIRKVKGTSSDMLFTFTHIDPRAPEREFFFNIYVDRANTYHVTQIAPAVPELEPLLRELNQRNEFGGFVRKMRAAFRRHVQLGGGQ